jgi:hypothetical protein
MIGGQDQDSKIKTLLIAGMQDLKCDDPEFDDPNSSPA